MRGDFLKSKAILMCFIIISSIFTIYQVDLVKAETNYCCELTKDNQFCQYTTEEQCNQEYLSTPVTCEQTSYCAGGCCISDQGKCSKNVPKTVCDNTEGYTWYDDAECNIAQCEKQCCTIADSICSYTTSAHCNKIDEQYPEISAEFVTVENEAACVNICTNSNKGCCVTPDTCTYDTKETCTSPEINLEEGTGFYENRFCSDLNLCGSIAQFSRKCVGEDAYWFDSFGNQEGIVKSGDLDAQGNKLKSGNCDYTQGTWCGYDELQQAECQDIDCKKEKDDLSATWDGIYNIDGISLRNTHDTTLGEEKEHGESWCLYESPTGDYLDRPGSQHYRAYCYFGEEIIEPCRDYREEVCIQAPSSGSETRGSACLDNAIYDSSLLNENVSTVPKGNKFWSETQDSTTCSSGETTCDVVFMKKSRSATKWFCVENCECLSEGWMINASKFCSSQGDCGANFNLVEEFYGSGFYITRSQEVLEAGKKFTSVAYDYSCAEEWSKENYGEDISKLCSKACTEFPTKDEAIKNTWAPTIVRSILFGGPEITPSPVKSGPGEEYCAFFDSINRSEWYTQGTDNYESDYTYNGKSMKYAYGVHGGLFSLYKAAENFLGTDQASEILSEHQQTGKIVATITGAVAGAIVLTAYIVGASIATTTGLTAGTGVLATLGAGFGLTVDATAVLTGAAPAATAAGPVGFIVAIALIIATILVLIFTSGGETQTITITAHCEPWQAPSGADYCELCDKPVSDGGLALDDGQGNVLTGYECTEYKCKSLGAACEYIDENAGTDREKCYNAYPNDVNHPEIKLDESIFETQGYEYDNKGDWVEVFDIQPYTQFHFGIITEKELSQCKIDTILPDTYEEMAELFPNSYYSKAHNQSRVLTPNETINYYIRCQDPMGNYNIDAFVFRVHTLATEDVQAPIIVATDIQQGSYIAYETQPTVTLYTNEPAQCRWATADQDFEVMQNYTLCSGQIFDETIYFENYCKASLTLDLGDNYFYFACQDYNNNTNTDTYELKLIGTEQLNIDRTSPNGTLYYNDVALQVETSIGAQNGKAICSYNGINFFQTNSTYHEQLFTDLPQATYTYDILCQDIAGNQNTTTIEFTVDIDESAPELIDLYIKDNTIYFTLNEQTSCQYHSQDFEFGEGTETTGTITIADTQQYHVKCQDIFDNEMSFIIET